MTERERYLEFIKIELEKCQREIDNASRLIDIAVHRKNGLLIARDHFREIYPESQP